MADIVEALTNRGSLYVAAAQEIIRLRQAVDVAERRAAEAEAKAKSLVAAPPPAAPASASSTKRPALPRPRKSIGTAVTQVGNEPLIYTAAAMEAYGDQCFAAGRRAGYDEAIAETGGADPRKTRSEAAIQAEETAWADHRAGRGPRPGRR